MLRIIRTVLRTGTGTDQNFIIGCGYLSKKRKLPVQTKTLLFVAGIFLAVIFLFPCYIIVICLCPTYQVMIVKHFSVFCFVGPQGCYCALNPKKTQGE